MPQPDPGVRRHTSVRRKGMVTSPSGREAVSRPNATIQPEPDQEVLDQIQLALMAAQ